MHAYIYLLALLSTFTAAQTNYCAGNKNITGYCETISYIDRTASSSRPPSIADCQDSCRGTLTDAGDWGISFIGGLNRNAD
jgi:hypothetical protein